MITAQKLIECVKLMSDAERREMAALFLDVIAHGPNPCRPAGETGYEGHQAFINGLTEKQAEQLQQICLLRAPQ